MSILCMSFADEEDVIYAAEADIQPLTDEEKLMRCEDTRRRLTRRCKGLLEVPMSEMWKEHHQAAQIYTLPVRPSEKGNGPG